MPNSTPSELIVHSKQPFNAEPSLSRLRASFVTAQSDLYVRSHGDIPELTEEDYRLRVDGAVAAPLDLTLSELRERFPERTVRATMQCAGDRRGDMLEVRPVSGDLWAAAAIGMADWTGVTLSNVLGAAEAETGGELHVVMAALDDCEADGERFRYEVSIPMSKARSPEVLLAWAINGEALCPEHGFPLHAVVPGYAGVRSPKWLSRITVQDRPSDAKPQARDYKLFPSTVTKETVDWDTGMTINDMPLNAALCEPAPASQLPAGDTAIRGYARPARSLVWRFQRMVGEAGPRRHSSRNRPLPGAGRSGKRGCSFPRESTNWSCGPWTPLGSRSPPSPTTSGTSRAISVPPGTACASASRETCQRAGRCSSGLGPVPVQR